MKTVNMTEQLSAMQRMFLPASTFSETMQKNACCFWGNQNQILYRLQIIANSWFERRHIGTHAALEAAQRMCKAETPVDLLREYQDWASGALQRMMTDGLACQQQFITVAGALAQPLASLGGEKGAEPSQTEAGPAVLRSKVA